MSLRLKKCNKTNQRKKHCMKSICWNKLRDCKICMRNKKYRDKTKPEIGLVNTMRQ